MLALYQAKDEIDAQPLCDWLRVSPVRATVLGLRHE